MSDATPNYITPEGAKKLQAELARLLSTERQKTVEAVAEAAEQGDRSENAEYIYGKKKLREIDRLIHLLTRRLESARVVEQRTDGVTAAYFGAHVEVEDEAGARVTYRIVGQDEIDLGKGHISWRSPLGRALLKRREGDTVVLRRPSGEVLL